MFLAILIVAVGYALYWLGSIYNVIVVDNGSWVGSISKAVFGEKEEDKPDFFPMPSYEPNRYDVLILGIRGMDQKEIEEEGGLLTDTILIASVDKINKKAALISIPRDFYVEMAGVKGKINEVYERGLEKGSGITLVKEVVSKISGIFIDKVIVFDFDAFMSIVEEMDGIDIYLAKPFKEANQWGYEFNLPAGNNHLNGEEALYYARSRFSTSDFDRARRQQDLIVAIKNKAVKGGYLTNPLKISGLLSSLKENVRTDIQIWDIKDLIDLAGSLGQKTEIKKYVLSIDNILLETKTAQGEYILQPKDDGYQEIKNVFKNIFQ